MKPRQARGQSQDEQDGKAMTSKTAKPRQARQRSQDEREVEAKTSEKAKPRRARRQSQDKQEGKAKTCMNKTSETLKPRQPSETTEAVEEATAATAASATTRAREGAHQDIHWRSQVLVRRFFFMTAVFITITRVLINPIFPPSLLCIFYDLLFCTYDLELR